MQPLNSKVLLDNYIAHDVFYSDGFIYLLNNKTCLSDTGKTEEMSYRRNCS